jgi:hypothetical protein
MNDRVSPDLKREEDIHERHRPRGRVRQQLGDQVGGAKGRIEMVYERAQSRQVESESSCHDLSS